MEDLSLKLANLLSPDHSEYSEMLEMIAELSYEQRMRDVFPGFDDRVSINPRLNMGAVLTYKELPEPQKEKERAIVKVMLGFIRSILPFKLLESTITEQQELTLWDVLGCHDIECCVEIPQLTSLISCIDSLCKIHDIGFNYDTNCDCFGVRINIVPYAENDLTFLTSDLKKTSTNLSWFKEALDKALDLERIKNEERQQMDIAELQRKEEAAARIKKEEIDRLKTEGINLPDGKYRLVKDSD